MAQLTFLPPVLTKQELALVLDLLKKERRRISVDYHMSLMGWDYPHYKNVAKRYLLIQQLELKLKGKQDGTGN